MIQTLPGPFRTAHTACNKYLVYIRNGELHTDGCHSDEEGVAKAAELHSRIFGADKSTMLMMTIESLPNVAVKINEEAAAQCASMIKGNRAI